MPDENKKDVKTYVQFQLHRNVIKLYKSLFTVVDDMIQEQESLIKNVKDVHGIDISNLDYLNKDKKQSIRKKILDAGNDTLRDLDKNFELIDITLQSDKLNLLKFTKAVKIEEKTGGNFKVKGQIL
tara:strand:+ start:4703 stop:5080 length:378 start_codon:yes stop_codon:yes gene_type:complete